MNPYYQLNKEKILNWEKKNYQNNKKIHSDKAKKYYLKHKSKILKQCKNYRETHKEEIKEYYLKNRNKILKMNKKYGKKRYQKNKKQIIISHIIYKKNKYRIDPNFRIICCLRSRFLQSLDGKKKIYSPLKLLGCSVAFLKKYLEKYFKSGMSWSNYGRWHIDHIRPCASFDLSRPSEQRKCFHYTNLQPLWAKENLSKGSKIK
jgi:hypothetical protein